MPWADPRDREGLAGVPVWDVHCSDFREFLSEVRAGTVDLALTDPPYAISRETGFQNVGGHSIERFAVSMDFGQWDQAEIDLDDLARGLYRALRKGGTAIVWYDIWKLTQLRDAMAAAGFKMLRLIFWQKTNPVPLNSKRTYLSNSREMAVVGVKVGKPTFHGEYDNGVYSFPIPRHGGKRIHPNQKPDGLFEALVLKHSNPGDLVIDPFVGGGTTGAAALQTGRHFWGTDIDPCYAEATSERLRATADGLD